MHPLTRRFLEGRDWKGFANHFAAMTPGIAFREMAAVANHLEKLGPKEDPKNPTHAEAWTHVSMAMQEVSRRHDRDFSPTAIAHVLGVVDAMMRSRNEIALEAIPVLIEKVHQQQKSHDQETRRRMIGILDRLSNHDAADEDTTRTDAKGLKALIESQPVPLKPRPSPTPRERRRPGLATV